MRFLLLWVAFLFVACASTGVVQVDDGTYSVSKKSGEFGFGEPVKTKSMVYEQANEFCAKQKKTVETTDLVVVNAVPLRPGYVSLEFRCMVGTESSHDKPAPVEVVTPDDTYNELLKLDDLRQRGILTDEEFAEQKRKLLESN